LALGGGHERRTRVPTLKHRLQTVRLTAAAITIAIETADRTRNGERWLRR